MTETFNALDRARAAGDPSILMDAIPYAKFLGLSLSLEEGRVIATLAASPDNIGNASLPALHGGTVGALLESVAIMEVLWGGGDSLPRTINLTIEYMRSGKLLDTFARASVSRAGRRVAIVRAEAWQEDPATPIAAATVHLLLGSAAESSP